MHFQPVLSFLIAAAAFVSTVTSADSDASEKFILEPSDLESIIKALQEVDHTIDIPHLQLSNVTNGTAAISVSNSATFDLVGVKDATTLQVTKDGYLVSVSANGGIKYATIAAAAADPAVLFTADQSYASPGFSISGGNLALNGTDSWLLSVNSTDLTFKANGASLLNGETVNIPLSLAAVGTSGGSTVPDYLPSLTINSGADIQKRHNQDSHDHSNYTYGSGFKHGNHTHGSNYTHHTDYSNHTHTQPPQFSDLSGDFTTTVTHETTALEPKVTFQKRADAVSQIGDGQIQAGTGSTAVAETTPAAAETTSAAAETTPAAAETTPAAVETTSAAVETTPAAAETTPATETTPAVVTSAVETTPVAVTTAASSTQALSTYAGAGVKQLASSSGLFAAACVLGSLLI